MLSDLMQRMSHREYRTRMAWLEEEWNNPSRTDYYLMKLIACVRGIFSKKSFDFRKEKIPFKSKNYEQKQQSRQTPEQMAAIAKQSVRRRFPGGRFSKKQKDGK